MIFKDDILENGLNNSFSYKKELNDKARCDNTNLNKAQKLQFDEYYTRYEDIHNEVINYKDQLKGKVVYCNCDNPYYSNFVKYFIDNFHFYGLKKLLSTNYSSIISDINFSLFDDGLNNKKSDFSNPYYFEYDGWLKDDGSVPNVSEIETKILKGNGSYDSPECIDVLIKSDIVITNPPFSKLKDFVWFLLKYNKDFLIIGNFNAFYYSKIFPSFKSGKVNSGYIYPKKYLVKYESLINKSKIKESNKFYINGELCSYISIGSSCWLTTLKVNKEPLKLTKSYYQNKDYYKFYDNYNALNVDSIRDIPYDYEGVMGVPANIVLHLNRDQFDVFGVSKGGLIYDNGLQIVSCKKVLDNNLSKRRDECFIDGKPKFTRVFIKLKNPIKNNVN